MLSWMRSQYFELWQFSLLLVSHYYLIPMQEVTAFVWSPIRARPGCRGDRSVLRAIPKKQKVYKHLFRHYDDIGFDSWLRCTDPQDFLYSVGFSLEEIEQMTQEYPCLLEQNAHSQLAPKIRFLVETMGGGTGTLTWSSDDEEAKNKDYSYVNADEECLPFEHENDDLRSHHSMRLSSFTKTSVPAWFFGCNLDRVIGPRHAYLAHHNLPHGSKLLHEYNGELFLEFLQSCRESNPKTSATSFLNLCTKWETRLATISKYDVMEQHHTQELLDTFEQSFGPGLLPAAYSSNTPLKIAKSMGMDIDPNKLIHLLATHGSNYLEYDTQGMTPLHWAAATNKVWGVQCLLQTILKSCPFSSQIENKIQNNNANAIADFILGEVDAKTGATSFHWACCGIQPGRRIGSGGSFDICRIMLEHSGERQGEVANAQTYSKSTPLMWASWASSSALDYGGGRSSSSSSSSNDVAIVDLLVLHGADLHTNDMKGRSAAHWAAAAGNLNMCEYLYECGVDFHLRDGKGKAPLYYAKSFNRNDVVQWLISTSTNLDEDSRFAMRGTDTMDGESM